MTIFSKSHSSFLSSKIHVVLFKNVCSFNNHHTLVFTCIRCFLFQKKLISTKPFKKLISNMRMSIIFVSTIDKLNLKNSRCINSCLPSDIFHHQWKLITTQTNCKKTYEIYLKLSEMKWMYRKLVHFICVSRFGAQCSFSLPACSVRRRHLNLTQWKCNRTH